MNSSRINADLLVTSRMHQLENIEFFEGISEEAMIELCDLMKEVKYKKNTVVMNQGELSRSLFIITTGRLKVFATDEEGHQTIFTFLSSGSFFGELSLLDEAPRSATVITLEETTALNLSHQNFSEFVNKHPKVCWPLFKSLAGRMRRMDNTICTLTSRDIYGRLVAALYSLAEEMENGALITQKLTHQDLAEMIGSSREMISRIFRDLKKGDYISVDKKRITILKKLPDHW